MKTRKSFQWLKKAVIILATMAIGFTSCERENIREDIFAVPKPCHVEAIYANIGRISINEKYDTPEVSDVVDNVEAEYFNISVLTFDSIIGWDGERLRFYEGIGQGLISSEGIYCEESIPEVERHIHEWAEEKNENSDPIWNLTWKSSTRLANYDFPYRLEGVTSFVITANKTFNGLEAGQDITDRFVIRQFSPGLVFSYDDYSVHQGGAITRTVSEWLAMKPLASPCILLRLTEGARETADDIAFTITMTLTDGKVLIATTPAIDII